MGALGLGARREAIDAADNGTLNRQSEAAAIAAGTRIMSSRPQISCEALTQFLPLQGGERYAYRRFGSGSGLPLLLLQHFTGTLDNWDPALTDTLAGERELILFDNAGVGRSSGVVPTTVATVRRAPRQVH